MGKNFEEYFKTVLERSKTEYTYDEKDIRDNEYYFEDCFRHDLSEYKALLFFHDYLEEIKGEITFEEFTEFNNIQQRYAFLYRRIENKVTHMLQTIWPEEEFIIDDIIFNLDDVEVCWSKIEPFENTIHFPNEWLFDKDWYKKYRDIEIEKMEAAIEELEEREQNRKDFFKNT